MFKELLSRHELPLKSVPLEKIGEEFVKTLREVGLVLGT